MYISHYEIPMPFEVYTRIASWVSYIYAIDYILRKMYCIFKKFELYPEYEHDPISPRNPRLQTVLCIRCYTLAQHSQTDK